MPYFIRNGIVITNVQAQIINDATPFAGGDVALIKGYTDGLINAVTHAHFTHTNVITEEDVIEVAAATQEFEIELDLNALAQICTIREYVKTDGTNYRLISAKEYPTDFDTDAKAIILSFKQKGVAYKITIQSAILEGASTDIPYRTITRNLV